MGGGFYEGVGSDGEIVGGGRIISDLEVGGLMEVMEEYIQLYHWFLNHRYL